jgi:TDG/mug DNA glycosylase family protein
VQELIGYQERIEWMGASVLTLAEVWPDNPRAVIVGINPSITSVAAGHYFQGQGARGRLMMLVRAGLLDLREGERHFERAAMEAGIAFADLVRRPTPSAGDLGADELAFGRSQFEEKMATRRVPLVIGIYAPPIESLLGAKAVAGYQPVETSWGARVFNLPRPYLRSELAAEVMSTFLVE